MDEQSRLPGVPQAGLLQETTFNVLLANALRRKRKAWRDQPETVIAERTRVVEGGEALRPDLLVSAPDSYPVAIETEWGEPASADAKNLPHPPNPSAQTALISAHSLRTLPPGPRCTIEPGENPRPRPDPRSGANPPNALPAPFLLV